ncbi:SRPBCC domain-containing protein [Streptomyces sp. DSM 44917]|uniref:SRPBCC domain-containing protein n=1 Tax=Streptomyces boetiae TaxID=3075541 RepID=A0ABU2LH60_9ACTN|nr:SRPBCC domain-containing protein [Streptomyces sp. DSM 44917]MDT0310597.1 SRPBCC domain-containing protein [Streptomyces sp. DSM 44917]
MEHEVFLPCPAGAVRAALGTLADPERLARCVPGLQLDADPSGAAAVGRLKLRIGSSSITYRGTLTLTERGEGVDVQAEGTEARGTGTASVLLSLVPRPVEDGSGTTLSFSGTIGAKGRLTDFDPAQRETAGRRLLDRFAAALGDVLGADDPGPDTAAAGRSAAARPSADAGGAYAADAAAESESGLDEPGAAEAAPGQAAPPADVGPDRTDGHAAGAGTVRDESESSADAAAVRDALDSSADAGSGLEGGLGESESPASGDTSGASADGADGLGESESAGAASRLAVPDADAAAEPAEGPPAAEAGADATAGSAVAGAEPGADAGPGRADAAEPARAESVDGPAGVGGREACADEEDVPVVGGIGGPEDNEPVIPGIPAAPEERGGAGVEIPAPAIDPEEEAVAEAAGVTAGPPEPEADFARRTMIGRSAEEVDHAPPRGRYAPAPAPGSVPDPASTLRWAAPTAALAVASALVLTRTLRRRARRRRS